MPAGESALPAGSNEWAYVVGLLDTSDTTFPLIADGFADLKSHAYTTDETARGGVWEGNMPSSFFATIAPKSRSATHQRTRSPVARAAPTSSMQAASPAG